MLAPDLCDGTRLCPQAFWGKFLQFFQFLNSCKLCFFFNLIHFVYL